MKSRSKKLGLSVLSSLFSKIVTSLFQLSILPLVAIKLGASEFIIYGMLGATLSWLSLSALGVGPAITKNVAMLKESEYSSNFNILFSNSIVIMFSFAILSVVLGCLLLNVFDVGETKPTFLKCILFVFVYFLSQCPISIVEAFILGEQKNYITNIVNALSTVASIIILFLFLDDLNTLFKIVLVVYLPNLLFRFINSCAFYAKHKHLRFDRKSLSKHEIKRLVQTGIAFTSSGSLNNFLSHMLPILLIGIYAPTNISAPFIVLINLVLLLSGFVNMFTIPLLPAFANAYSLGDKKWLYSTFIKLVLFSSLIGLGTIFMFNCFGVYIFEIWFKNSIVPEQSSILYFTLYFCLVIWEMLVFSLMGATSSLSKISKILFFKAVVISLVIFLCLTLEIYAALEILVVLTFAFGTLPISKVLYFQFKNNDFEFKSSN